MYLNSTSLVDSQKDRYLVLSEMESGLHVEGQYKTIEQAVQKTLSSPSYGVIMVEIVDVTDLEDQDTTDWIEGRG